MTTNPQWYFMYRGNGYGPFKDLDEAFAKYESKGSPGFGTVDRWDFFRYFALYGEAVVDGKDLVRFEHVPKPFTGVRRLSSDHIVLSPFSGHARLYPFGYST